jgi:Tfp pilus assembly protein PilN
MRAFNLLHYPALASQRRRRYRLWTAMAGWVVGAVLAVGVAQVVQEAADQAAQERQRVQAQLAEQQAQWGKVQKALSAQQKWHVQSAHLAQIQRQHVGWQALHHALQNELGPGSVQLTRLQLEATQLQLQGSASDVQRMDAVRHAVSAHLAQHWPSAMVLGSLVVVPSDNPKAAAQAKANAQALEFVWQSGWPAWSGSAQPGSAAKSNLPTDRVLP